MNTPSQTKCTDSLNSPQICNFRSAHDLLMLFDFPMDEVEQHMVGDSSSDDFCFVAFIRDQKSAASKFQLAFVFNKAIVDRMRVFLLSKLELQAAHMLLV